MLFAIIKYKYFSNYNKILANTLISFRAITYYLFVIENFPSL